jgi:hypothetical protein
MTYHATDLFSAPNPSEKHTWRPCKINGRASAMYFGAKLAGIEFLMKKPCGT